MLGVGRRQHSLGGAMTNDGGGGGGGEELENTEGTCEQQSGLKEESVNRRWGLKGAWRAEGARGGKV